MSRGRVLAVLLGAAVTAGCSSPRSTPSTSVRTEPATARATGASDRATAWQTIGSSNEGRAIRAKTFGEGGPRVYLIGSIHGDETQGLHALGALAEPLSRAEGVTVRIVEDMNPDGTSMGVRGNSRGVDLNRNWPAQNFRAGRSRGAQPLSEPETRAVLSDMNRFGPATVVVLHSTPSGPFVNYDGPASDLAEAFAAAAAVHDARWHVRASMGYPTPGSLGTLVGVDRGVPILTIEFDKPYDEAMAESVLVDGVGAVVDLIRPARRTARTR